MLATIISIFTLHIIIVLFLIILNITPPAIIHTITNANFKNFRANFSNFI